MFNFAAHQMIHTLAVLFIMIGQIYHCPSGYFYHILRTGLRRGTLSSIHREIPVKISREKHGGGGGVNSMARGLAVKYPVS